MPSWPRRDADDVDFPPAVDLSDSRIPMRLLTFFILTISEIFLASFVYDSPRALPDWQNPILYANRLALIGLLAFAAFALVAWPRRGQIAQVWRGLAQRQNWGAAVLTNLILFAMLLLARVTLAQSDPQPADLYLYWGYSFLLLAVGASLAPIAAPISFWRYLLKTAHLEIFLALTGAIFIVFAGELFKESWDSLAAGTLALSHWFLGLYESNIYLDTQNRILGAEDYRVWISAQCSGIEGIGLVVTFLSIYLWIFRSHLRFPNALLLLPVGVAAIWALNSVRIALLVSIGAHISPTIATGGAHSWVGWIMFLVVTVGIMAAVPNIRYFWTSTDPRSQTADHSENSNDRYVFAFLAPFAALMASSIVASAFAPADQWLYTLKVVAVGATLWWFRDVYSSLISSVSPVSVAAGLIIGVLWIATDPNLDAETPLGPWLASLPASLAFLWLAIRAFGSVVLVPIAEELAFRGYLYRALSFMRFEALGPVQFRWFALIASSLAFGILHERWLAASLAGAVYALLMYRSNKLADPIAAHMASNAAIVVWSISTEQWALL